MTTPSEVATCSCPSQGQFGTWNRCCPVHGTAPAAAVPACICPGRGELGAHYWDCPEHGHLVTALARRCRHCEARIVPPEGLGLGGESVQDSAARAAAALGGFCSVKCQTSNAIETLNEGKAWWQREVRRG